MANLSNEQLLESLQQGLGDKVISHDESYGMLAIEVSREHLTEAVEWLKNSPELRFIYLTDLCGMHFPENTNRELGVVCHLHSLEFNMRLRIRTYFPVADPWCPSLTGLYAGANWMERETFDFYGVDFKGHPDLRRILNMDSMDYFPLRKEYALEDETRSDKSDKFFGR